MRETRTVRRPALITCPSDPPTDRDALIVLYCATGGASWTNRGNWLSSNALNSWHGVAAITDNTVTRIILDSNNLTGTIPSELGNLGSLRYFWLGINQLTGAIPSELGTLTKLVYLYLNDNDLSGTIPIGLEDLTKLQCLYLQSNTMLSGGTALIGEIEILSTTEGKLQELGLWGNDDLTGGGKASHRQFGQEG